MSVARMKAALVQLERKRNKLRLAASRLEGQHHSLVELSKAVDVLVQHQQAVANMLHEYYQGNTDSSFPSLDEDTGLMQPALYEWPLMAQLQSMELADYDWLLSATTQQVCAQILENLQQLALLTNYHKSGMESSQQLLDAAMAQMLHLTKAMYILTPHIVYDLNNMNMITGCHEEPPQGHWERAFLASQPSEEQLLVMRAVLQQIVPKMEQLELERKQLAEMIHSVKAFSLREQDQVAQLHQQHLAAAQDHQQQQQRKEGVQQAFAGSTVAKGTSQRPGTRSRTRQHQQQGNNKAGGTGHDTACAADSAHSIAPALGYYTALLQEATTLPPAAACNTEAVGTGTAEEEGCRSVNHSAPSCCGSTAQPSTTTCKDMVNEMDSRLLRWRTLSGARSAVTYVLRSEQLANILLAAFPYLPMTACMCDYFDVALAKVREGKQ